MHTTTTRALGCAASFLDDKSSTVSISEKDRIHFGRQHSDKLLLLRVCHRNARSSVVQHIHISKLHINISKRGAIYTNLDRAEKSVSKHGKCPIIFHMNKKVSIIHVIIIQLFIWHKIPLSIFKRREGATNIKYA